MKTMYHKICSIILSSTIIFVLILSFCFVAYSDPPAGKGHNKKPSAPVPQTGQTDFYAADDDGDLQMGVEWPVPRFTDNEDGTVTDNLTGLMWTKNVRQVTCDKYWDEALTACSDLVFADYDDWRLPNINELRSLIDHSNYNPALPDGHPFTNPFSWGDLYWSSTTLADNEGCPDHDCAWYMRIYRGDDSSSTKSGGHHCVWPVRGPDKHN